ncbi:MAG: gluconokinase, GntK/IdnK-type [Desulfobacterales bacterium]
MPEQSAMVLILMGPMGCGKTTVGRLLAKKIKWPFYDGDDFHPQANIEKMRAGIALSDEDRTLWLETLRNHIRQWLREGTSAILACSALKQAYRLTLGVNQRTIRTVYLKGSFSLLRQRIEQRRHPYMDKNLLKSQLEILEEPRDGWSVDISAAPEAIADTIIAQMAESELA